VPSSGNFVGECNWLTIRPRRGPGAPQLERALVANQRSERSEGVHLSRSLARLYQIGLYQVGLYQIGLYQIGLYQIG
jgi:hypothetical protein